MNMPRYFLCFVLFSFIGWAYESVYYTIQQRRPVNSGFLTGCICPIYGIGGLMILMFLGDMTNGIYIFFAGMLVTCTLEYIVSWLLEKLFKKRWWDYTNWPMNINGRVCIFAGTAFGIMAVVQVKVIGPMTTSFMMSLTDKAVTAATVTGIVLMLADLVITVCRSDKFADKLWYVKEQQAIFEEGGLGYRLREMFFDNMPDVHPISTISKICEDRFGKGDNRFGKSDNRFGKSDIIERIKKKLDTRE